MGGVIGKLGRSALSSVLRHYYFGKQGVSGSWCYPMDTIYFRDICDICL
jgi:hypothetical protein